MELLHLFDPVGFWRIDLDTSHTYVSAGNAALFGKSSSSGPINVAEYCERIHPDDLDRFLNALEQAAREKTSYNVCYRLVIRGKEIAVQTIGRYRTSQGTSGEIIGITIRQPQQPEVPV
ncbi:PAS domain-containing protein [Rhizobium oryzicola]|uniref:PAS domain-containing protein n=1 Tax=Rhizobium oryzicola TaxID=1232668 RepID=A0ABT8SV10_9HYPH|nr:PAS domain-containing protein [Rhizobium oryzicola]MDO1582280.1 PAS domain-containing protein [Rhizobium oryzicola]